MSKVIVNSVLTNKKTKEQNKIQTTALLKENKLIFVDKNCLVKIKFEHDSITMIREVKNENRIKFLFKHNTKTTCNYDIYNKTLELNLFTNVLKISDNEFYIDYVMEESEELIFELSIKEIEWLNDYKYFRKNYKWWTNFIRLLLR